MTRRRHPLYPWLEEGSPPVAGEGAARAAVLAGLLLLAGLVAWATT